MVTDNAYAELGLAPGASEAEVKVAWRRLASQWHPDRNRSAAAIGKMQRINQALEQIRRSGFFGDAEPAATEPREPPEPSRGADRGDRNERGAADASDAAGEGTTASRTIKRSVRLTLEEAAVGCVKVLRGETIDHCPACAGAGVRVLGGACAECAGSGAVRQRAWYGWFGLPAECTSCRGDGVAKQPCAACGGSGKPAVRNPLVNVRIPHGVRDGDLLHVDGRRLRPGQPAPHIDLRIEVLPHALFELDADGTVRCQVPVDGFAWIANRSIDVPTLNGLQRLPLSRDQLSYRLNGQGFPVERRGLRGDHVVKLQPVFPERLSTDQEILLDQLVATASGVDGEPADRRLGDWQRALRGWAQGGSSQHQR